MRSYTDGFPHPRRDCGDYRGSEEAMAEPDPDTADDAKRDAAADDAKRDAAADDAKRDAAADDANWRWANDWD